jgi:hypothetical protein
MTAVTDLTELYMRLLTVVVVVVNGIVVCHPVHHSGPP